MLVSCKVGPELNASASACYLLTHGVVEIDAEQNVAPAQTLALDLVDILLVA